MASPHKPISLRTRDSLFWNNIEDPCSRHMSPFDNHILCYLYTHQETTIPQDAARKKQRENECQELKMMEEAGKVVVRVPVGMSSTKPKEQAAKKASSKATKVTDKSTTKPINPSNTKTGSVQKAYKKGQKSAPIVHKNATKGPQPRSEEKVTVPVAKEKEKSRVNAEVTKKRKSRVDEEFKEEEFESEGDESPPLKAVARGIKRHKESLYDEESDDDFQYVNVHDEGQIINLVRVYATHCFVA